MSQKLHSLVYGLYVITNDSQLQCQVIHAENSIKSIKELQRQTDKDAHRHEISELVLPTRPLLCKHITMNPILLIITATGSHLCNADCMLVNSQIYQYCNVLPVCIRKELVYEHRHQASDCGVSVCRQVFVLQCPVLPLHTVVGVHFDVKVWASKGKCPSLKMQNNNVATN